MLRWIASWAARYAPTVEQQAQKALPELRLELFQAEQRILDAQVHADYYRAISILRVGAENRHRAGERQAKGAGNGSCDIAQRP